LIRVQSAGGLGNQLFTFNLAHALANHYHTSIRIMYPNIPGNRECELELLLANCKHDISVSRSFVFDYLLRILDKVKNHSSFLNSTICSFFRIYRSELPSDTFDFRRSKPAVVRGYYQSPGLVFATLSLYAHEISQCVESEFKKAPKIIKDIKNYSAIHIRRGDFLENKQTVGLLSLEYFRNNFPIDAFPIICTDAAGEDPSIEEKFPIASILSGDQVSPWVSFAILAKSNYLLVSNSTFSWWAGLFVIENGGTVVAPDPWTITAIYGDSYLKIPLFQYVPAEFELK